jgi:beta-glucosidase-like glycosyl hydrolase/CubicO group peptidase (beta-lactamase class C family)
LKISYVLGVIGSFLLLSFTGDGEKTRSPFEEIKTPWADSLHAELSLDEKIGQLFNVAAYSNRGEEHRKEVLQLIRDYKIGGLTFFQGGPLRQARLCNEYQEASAIPLMVAMDAEWGLSMRLDSTLKYPWQMTLGAIQNDSLIYEMGLQIAEQCRRLGVHVNFAPVVDINNNPDNPVIFARSFGEDKENVARKSIAYIKGLQDGRVLATAKHFPGHGDTDTDSHISLPVVKHDRQRLDEVELYPFREVIREGVGSIMTAHLYLPELIEEKKASSLSAKVVDTLLKQDLGYSGLIFTDGLNMGGVSRYQASEQVDIQAILAGNDVLLLSRDVAKAVEAIKQALADGRLQEQQIDAASLKILRAKEWLGLHQLEAIKLEGLYEDLNASRYHYLNHKLSEESLTLLRNEEERLPIKDLNDKRIIALAFTEKNASYRGFQQSLNRYTRVDTLHYSSLPVSEQTALMDTLLTYDEVIVSIHSSNKHPWVSEEINNEFKNFCNLLRLKKKISLVLFVNPYCLKNFLAANYSDALLMAYQNSAAAQELSAQLIFGGIQTHGRLPISGSDKIGLGAGLSSKAPFRLKYTLPEEVGLKSADLDAVTEIVEEGLQEQAYPGVQVWIAKEGKVIYQRSFGNTTYESAQAVKESDLYDLASVTKIASTLLAVMQLDSKGKLSLDDPLGKHLKMCRGTAYEDLRLRDILAHQAGLAAWIPFYIKTLEKGVPRYDLYSRDSSKKFSQRVAEDLYITPAYEDTIFYRILYRAKVAEKKEYRYSDVGYYFLKEIVEHITGEEINEYNQENFYKPLGMNRTGFLPRESFSLSEIIPTERDNYFRKQLIHGDVHDPGAAMLGGVGGHAGLFSNANDLGKLMQMYLQEGSYGGQEYLKKEVVEMYTKCQFCEDSVPRNKEENRRGAGFDKPAFHGNPGPTCDCISFNSYGHSGFTGTYAWVDPDEDLVYIFLSNRVYPSAENKKLLNLNIRTRIQEKIYDAISNSRYRLSQNQMIE